MTDLCCVPSTRTDCHPLDHDVIRRTMRAGPFRVEVAACARCGLTRAVSKKTQNHEEE